MEKLSISSLPESLLIYINSYLNIKNYIFSVVKSSGKIYLRHKLYFLAKLLPKLTTRFEKKVLYRIMFLHHAKVTFSNGARLTMIDQRMIHENGLTAFYFEYSSKNVKSSASYTTYEDFELISNDLN